MSLTSDLQDIDTVAETLSSNKVVNFAYSQNAYDSNAVAYDEDEGNLIPDISDVPVNQNVLNKGLRDQSSSMARQFINHFCGRSSYNLNKIVDTLRSFLSVLSNSLGASGGIATLDADGRVPSSQITETLIEYKGTWDASTNTPDLLTVAKTKGDMYFVSKYGEQDLGSGEEKFYEGDQVIYNGTEWQKIRSGNVNTVNNVSPDSSKNVTITGEDIDLPAVILLAKDFKQSNITSDYFYVLCYANGMWVAGSYSDNGLYYSTDGITWTRSNIRNYDFHSVYYGNGMWVAGSYSETGLYYSTDGITWYESNITDVDGLCLYYTNGLWVAGLSNGLYYSSDGMTWTQSNITSGSFKNVYYGNGKWVAGSYSRNGLYYSSDGMTWTQSNMTSGNFYSVYYGNGVWVAGSNATAGLYYSSDGMTWTQSNITSGGFYGVDYANGKWVACSNSNGLYYSTDGMTWTQSNITSGGFYSVYYGNGVWVAGSTTRGLYYSTDGMTWNQSNITNSGFLSVCYSNGLWVAGANSDNGLYYSKIRASENVAEIISTLADII